MTTVYKVKLNLVFTLTMALSVILCFPFSVKAESLQKMAQSQFAAHKYAEAATSYENLIKQMEDTKQISAELAVCQSWLAECYSLLNRKDDAISFYRKSIETCDKIGYSHDKYIVIPLNKLVGLLQEQRKNLEATPFAERIVQLQIEKYGRESEEVEEAQLKLGELYDAVWNYGKLEPIYKEVLRVREKRLGQWHREVGDMVKLLGDVARVTSRPKESEQLYQRAILIYRHNAHGGVSGDIAIVYFELGHLYQDQAKFAESEEFYKKSLDIYEKIHGKNSAYSASVIMQMSYLFTSSGNYEKAEEYTHKALEIDQKVKPGNDDSIALDLMGLARIQMHRNEYAEAEKSTRQALSILKGNHGDNYPHVATCLMDLSNICIHEHKKQEAIEFTKQVLNLYLNGMKTPDSGNLISTYRQLGGLYDSDDNVLESAKMYFSAQLIEEKINGRALLVDRFEQLAQTARKSVCVPSTNELTASMKNMMREAVASAERRDWHNYNVTANRLLTEAEKQFGKNSLPATSVREWLAVLNDEPDKRLQQIETLIQILHIRENLAGDASSLVAETNLQIGISMRSIGANAGRWLLRCQSQSNKILAANNRLNLTVPKMLMLNSIALASVGYMPRSIQVADQAFKVLRENSIQQPSLDLTDEFHQLGMLLQLQGQLIRAKESFTEELVRARQLNNLEHQFIALVSLGIIADEELDAERADQHCQSALALQSKAFRPDQQQLRNCLQIASHAKLLKNQINEAEALIVKALENSPEHNDIWVTLSQQQCEILIEKKQWSRAFSVSEQAVKATSERKDAYGRLLSSKSYLLIARTTEANKQFEEAKHLYAKAADLARGRVGSESTLCYVNGMNGMVRCLAAEGSLADARLKAMEGSKAFSNYIESIFPQLSFAEQCLFIGAARNQRDILLTYCSDEASLPTAYNYLMRWKSMLIESLRRRTAINVATTASSETRNLVEKLNKIQNQISNLSVVSGGTSGATDLNQQLLEKEELESSLNKLSNVNVHDALANVTPAALANMLPKDDAFVDVIAFRDRDDSKYGAVVSLPGGKTKFALLGSKSDVDNAINIWRSEVLAGGSDRRDVKVVQSLASLKFNSKDAQLAEKKLAVFWQRISAELPPSTKHAWLCLDSETATFPWSTIVTKSTIPELVLAQVDSPRQLVSVINLKPCPQNEPSMLLAGGIDFATSWVPNLVDTLPEVNEIAELASVRGIKPNLLKDREPTPAAIKQAFPKSTYIHLATHGFFTSQKAPDSELIASRSAMPFTLPISRGANVKILSARDPLLESGFYLARESTASGTEINSPGIMTAQDLVGLDLHHCSLLTLSACQTGLGRGLSGQGLVGLRSALIAAGTQTILISLWKVDDAATRFLMKTFYSKLFDGYKPCDALKLAQAAVRNQRGNPEWTEPKYWAAWIIAGRGW